MTRPQGERVVPSIGGFGVTTWSIPGTSLIVLWPGPASRLLVGRGTTFMPISHPRANDVYDTLTLARAAVAKFLQDAR
jgi:hypothetical protein